MKVAQFEQAGGPDVLRIIEQEKPSPGRGQVLVRVTSAGLNRADTLFRAGTYFQRAQFPSRSGMEGAGVVETVGEGCSKFKPGDRVAALPAAIAISAQGAAAEYAVWPEGVLIPTPEKTSDEDAGGIWMQYLTAWGAINYLRPTKAGEFVIVSAGSSSVGLAAVQIAKDLGAVTIATTTSADKAERIRENGADHVIDVRNESYRDRVKEITKGKGAQAIFDPVAGKMMEDHVKCVAQRGTIFVYGVLDLSPMVVNAGHLVGKNAAIQGYTLMPLLQDPKALAVAVAAITERLNDGRFKLIIDSRFPLEKVADAHRHMESNRQFGKIVVTP